MGIRKFEQAILKEAREVFQNPKLRLANVMEWTPDEVWAKEHLQEHEVLAVLPELLVWVAIEKKHDKRQG